MTERKEANGSTVVGHVKWFDSSRGYGFVVSDDGGPDILLHANVLRSFGQNSLADGARIELVVQQTERGMQATEVVAVRPPVATGAGPLIADLEEHGPEAIAAQPLQPARVKWFDKNKGFGFANVYGCPEDIFVHAEVVRRSGLAELGPGEAVCLKVIDGRRGRLAAEVRGWDSATRDTDESN